MESIWVIGAGKFGKRAVELLHSATSSTTFVLVDQQPVTNLPPDIDFVCSDGVEWLVQQSVSDSDTALTKIIPVIPVHLTAEWLKRKLAADGGVVSSVRIPESLLDQLPHPMRLRSDKVVISYADFICPDNCLEPDEICTHTQELRPQPLYEVLEKMDIENFIPIIVRSKQFAPGVGGFYLKDLCDLLTRARSLPDVPLLIGTACKCHGVIDSVSYKVE
jgi:hypothetical protein